MRILGSIVVLLALAGLVMAAQPAAGDWEGVITIGEMKLRLALHVTESGKGLNATFDSIDQNAMGMPVDKIEFKDQQLTFELASIQAVYTGTLNKAGTTITGSWKQIGQSFPVNFQKKTSTRK